MVTLTEEEKNYWDEHIVTDENIEKWESYGNDKDTRISKRKNFLQAIVDTWFGEDVTLRQIDEASKKAVDFKMEELPRLLRKKFVTLAQRRRKREPDAVAMAAAELSAPSRNKKRQRKSQEKMYDGRRPWSDDEKNAIIEGIRNGLLGKWAEIKKESGSILLGRTSGQIKDCFRTMRKRGELEGVEEVY